MKEGDFAGLALLQKKYGQIGVKIENGLRSLVMVSGESRKPVIVQSIPLHQETIFLKAECDFRDRSDIGYFFTALMVHRGPLLGNRDQDGIFPAPFYGLSFRLV